MIEVAGLVWLVAGLLGLALSAALVAACLRLRSPGEYLLAAYTLAWAWLVAVVLVLSPLEWVTEDRLAVGIGVGLVGAGALWVARGRPRPPSFGPTLRAAGVALGSDPWLLVLGIAVAAGLAYSAVLAFLVPANDGDALAYHLARAAFWRQEHGLGYIAGAPDLRMNVNPPNAEIGQLATMLLSGGERYVALPQLAAYLALVLCVAVLGRRLGLDVRQAVFGALAFATLPVVALQASAALNDLVVASFLASAVVFALREGRLPLALLALAVGLAVGTKFTALLALPTLALVAAVARPARQWLQLALAGTIGLILGSAWYLVNLVETGGLDGGLADSGDQRVDLSPSAVAVNAMELGLDVLDMSGAERPHVWLFLAAGGVLAVTAVVAGIRGGRPRRRWLGVLAAAAVTCSVVLADRIADAGQRVLERAWARLSKPEQPEFEAYLELNVTADAVESWYGPLGALLLVAGLALIVALRIRRRASTLAVAFALAPWTLLLTLAALVVWDPFRGRFLVFGVALAAATWGLLARLPVVVPATVAVGVTSLGLALANYQGKPSGFAELWPRDEIHFVSVEPIWGADRAEALARLRPEEGEEELYRFLDRSVPADADIALALRDNDFVSPFFGPRLSRRVSFASRTRPVEGTAGWLVLAPAADAGRCRASWRRVLTLGSGWRVERRVAPDRC